MKKFLLFTVAKIALFCFCLPVFSQELKLIITGEEAKRMFSNGFYDEADKISKELLKINPLDTVGLRIQAQALTEKYYNIHLEEYYSGALPILNQLINNGDQKLLIFRSRLYRSKAKKKFWNDKELHNQHAQLALNDLLEYEKLFPATKLTAYYKSDLLKMLGK